MPLYPEIEPDAHGLLDVGDGNHVHWETSGNPDGTPALLLHGGPGSGSTPTPAACSTRPPTGSSSSTRRGSGRSVPHASRHDTDMSVNTTDRLLADLELLRRHLDIERWLVWGVSWGSALALRYAQTHPGVVTQLVLTGVATGSDAEVELLTRGWGRLFPAAFEAFLAGLPADDRDGNLAAAYNRLLESPTPRCGSGQRGHWTDWETAVIPAPPRSVERFEDPVFRQGFARTVHPLLGQRPLPRRRGRRRGSDPARRPPAQGHPRHPRPGAASTSATCSAPSGGSITPGPAASW